MRAVDVVVIGAGVMGAAAARALALAGRAVVLLEQFHVGHRRGSSHGRSRIFRLSYDDPAIVRLARVALPLWRDLEAESGRALLHPTGGFDVGPGAEAHAAALAAAGVAFERLDADEARARFPGFAPRAGEPLVFQADTGYLAADRVLGVLVGGGLAAGAELMECAAVEGLSPDGDVVDVVTADETYRAGAVVVTAGGWARPLLAAVGIELSVTPTRETICYFGLGAEPLPVVVDWRIDGPPVYALPSPGQGIKVGEHHAGPVADPDEEGAVGDDSAARVAAWVAERFPQAERPAHTCETCLYTSTADHSFVLERRGRIVIGSACSGHGFKFAPIVGERLAGLAMEATG